MDFEVLAEGLQFPEGQFSLKLVRPLPHEMPPGAQFRMTFAVDDLRFEVERLPKSRRILVHCRSGFRAHLAVRILKQRGFADVAHVTGGYLSMLAEGGFNWETP